jgi:hypothetical protein
MRGSEQIIDADRPRISVEQSWVQAVADTGDCTDECLQSFSPADPWRAGKRNGSSLL